jgi:glycosyltransferase involved in cell wall biosynthesis
MHVRIGFDGTPLMGQRTGVGNYTGRLLEALLKLEPDWEYLLYSNRPLGQLETALQKAIQWPGYLPQSRWLWIQTVLPWLIARTRPQLAHFPNGLAPLWLPVPFAVTIHDASLFLYSYTHPHARLLAIRLILPLVARRAAAVITVSHHARRDLLRVLRLPPEKVEVVYQAAPASFRPVRERTRLARLQRALRQKYRLPEEIILFVGTLEPRKNLVRLLRAFAQVRRCGYRHKLVLVGARGWLMEAFDRELEGLGLADAVQHLGYVAAADLPGLYNLATLFVFPSLYEGFGMPPLEAMACGTPVVTSNNSALREVCGDAAHLVDPLDEESLAEGMLQLLGSAERRAELSQRGLKRAARFSWRETARQTRAVYESICHSTCLASGSRLC